MADLATIIATASAAISAGASLTGTTLTALMNTGYNVNCGIEVENWTKFPLLKPYVTLHTGMLQNPPFTILPSKREAMVARKSGHCATGSCGVVSWKIDGMNRLVVVMWSVPYDQNIHSNWLAVGITKKGDTSTHENWFDEMYYGSPTWFQRREYYRDSNTMIIDDTDFEVHAIMGTTHQAVIKLQIAPKNLSFLANPVKSLLSRR